MNSYTTPTAVWLKDGASARTTPTNMVVGGNGYSTLPSPSPSRSLMLESINAFLVGVAHRCMEQLHSDWIQVWHYSLKQLKQKNWVYL